jgi:hypothetical protein
LLQQLSHQADGHDLATAPLLVLWFRQAADAFTFERNEVVVHKDEYDGEQVYLDQYKINRSFRHKSDQIPEDERIYREPPIH